MKALGSQPCWDKDRPPGHRPYHRPPKGNPSTSLHPEPPGGCRVGRGQRSACRREPGQAVGATWSQITCPPPQHDEVDILGLDGHIYKGRMDSRLPGIPNRDSEYPGGLATPQAPRSGPRGPVPLLEGQTLLGGHWTPAAFFSTSLTPNAQASGRPRSLCAGGDTVQSWPPLLPPAFILTLPPRLSCLSLCPQLTTPKSYPLLRP